MKENKRIRYMAYTAIFAAMITIMTAYIGHIPVGSNGGYIHFGDSLIYLAAVLLPAPYALVAAAIGGGLADLLTAPMWVPATIIIKMLITVPFTSKHEKIIHARNVAATAIAFILSGTGYYIAELILFHSSNPTVSLGLFLHSLFGSAIQSGGSAIIFIVLGIVLDRIGFKRRFFPQNLHK